MGVDLEGLRCNAASVNSASRLHRDLLSLVFLGPHTSTIFFLIVFSELTTPPLLSVLVGLVLKVRLVLVGILVTLVLEGT